MIIEFPAADPVQAALGRRLRLVREARGLSAQALAGRCGFSTARLGLAETGRTRLTSAELHALITELRIPLGLLYASADVSRLRPL